MQNHHTQTSQHSLSRIISCKSKISNLVQSVLSYIDTFKKKYSVHIRQSSPRGIHKHYSRLFGSRCKSWNVHLLYRHSVSIPEKDRSYFLVIQESQRESKAQNLDRNHLDAGTSFRCKCYDKMCRLWLLTGKSTVPLSLLLLHITPFASLAMRCCVGTKICTGRCNGRKPRIAPILSHLTFLLAHILYPGKLQIHCPPIIL